MSAIPNLKRITVASIEHLNVWLSKNAHTDQSIMLVTHSKPTSDKHLSTDQVQKALAAHGWTSNRCYTMNTHLLGRVIARAPR